MFCEEAPCQRRFIHIQVSFTKSLVSKFLILFRCKIDTHNIIIVIIMLCQFTYFIEHIHNLSNNYGRVYATAFANYSSPYKTNMTRVHFKLSFTKRTYIHTLKLITTSNNIGSWLPFGWILGLLV